MPLRGEKVYALHQPTAGQGNPLLAEDVGRMSVEVELEHLAMLVIIDPRRVRHEHGQLPRAIVGVETKPAAFASVARSGVASAPTAAATAAGRAYSTTVPSFSTNPARSTRSRCALR